MDQEIDLGVTNDERYGGMSVAPTAEKGDKKSYPSFHYSGDKSLGLPKDGTMTVKFCVVSETESTRDGKDHYECTIEVRSICDVEGDSDADEAPQKVGDILDSLMEKYHSEKE